MVDQGYLDARRRRIPDDAAQAAAASITNPILDIRLHTMGMTTSSAGPDEREAFQEPQEAAAKLLRAKLSSCQLTSYYAGLKAGRDPRPSARGHTGRLFAVRLQRARAQRGRLDVAGLARLLQ